MACQRIELKVAKSSDQHVAVQQVFVNPNYMPETKIADLTLLYLEEPLVISELSQPLPLEYNRLNEGVLADNHWAREHKFIYRIADKSILNSPQEKEDLRYAPLTIQVDNEERLVAIPSYAMTKDNELYVYYPPIARYTEWLEAVMKSVE